VRWNADRLLVLFKPAINARRLFLFFLYFGFVLYSDGRLFLIIDIFINIGMKLPSCESFARCLVAADILLKITTGLFIRQVSEKNRNVHVIPCKQIKLS
jgi:hypothetical protein